MSKLEFYARPLVAFDVQNKNHRRWYHEFVQNGGWGKCPVRFICPHETGSDLVKMITRLLVEYYVSKEFVVKKPQRSKVGQVADKLVAQKKKKVVDKAPKK